MTIGVARPALPFTRGIDSLTPILNNVARQFKADGYEFVGQYAEVLTPAVRDGIFAAGLAILLLTEATTNVSLNAELGSMRGTSSAHHATALDAPSRIHIVIDIESTKGDADSVTAFTNAFHDELVNSQYDSMVYVGIDQPLNSDQLTHLKTHRYMRSGSIVPEPRVGFCCLQLSPLDQIIHGQRVDVDVIQQDALGRTPILWWPN
jgi:hypothetical protein